jgi:hypothetical protein
MGRGPEGSLHIDPGMGAPQADIFRQYKEALIRATALDKATREEERRAKRDKRSIRPNEIERLVGVYTNRTPYKARGCRFHSFVVYFSTLQRLGWVEFTGREEPSAFQDHFASGPPRRYFRITATGQAASDRAWANPHLALYGRA